MAALADYYIEIPIDWPRGQAANPLGSGGYTYVIAGKVGATRIAGTAPPVRR